MTGEPPAKLRFVRCPKCRRVLPELPNVPVYQCGGCGTVLQAKKRKVNPEDAEQQVNESVPIQRSESENISSEKDAQKFSQEETIPSTDQHPVETNCESNPTEIQICNEEHPADAESSPEMSKKSVHSGNANKGKCVVKEAESSAGSSEGLVHYHNVGLTSEVYEDECVSKDTEPLTISSEKLIYGGNLESTLDVDEDEYALKGAESSTGFPIGFIHHGDARASPETDCESKSAKSSTPDIEIDECVSDDGVSSNGLGDPPINHGNVETDTERGECLPKQTKGSDEEKDECCIEKPYRHVSFSGELVYLPEVNHLGHEDDENETNQRKSLSGIETDVKSDEEFRSHSIFGSSPEDEILDKSALDNDSLSEELENSHYRKPFYNHVHMSSVDTLDNITALRDLPESPIARSYYGFYGSGSSCDGTDDQVPDCKFHLSRRTFRKEFTNGKSLLSGGESPKKSKGGQEMQGQNEYFSSSSSGMRQSEHHGRSIYETNVEKIGHQPSFPFYSRDQGIGYTKGNYLNDDIGTEFHLPNKREYLEVEKMELIQKVRELEDQLKRTHIYQGKQNVNFSGPRENQVHSYYDNFTNNQNYGNYHEGKSGSNQSRVSRIPFSSEATTGNKIHTNNSDAMAVRAERLYIGKKHILPVTGGAPFLLCYGCSEVLQMPADFLLFKRRYHKLMCGNCSVILKFSLQNRTQIVKYIDQSSVDLDQTEPFSIDEPGPSFCKSFSIEEAPSSSIEPQLDEQKRIFSEKKMSSSKKGSKFTKFVKNLGLIRSSSKRSKAESSTSESEEVPASANSPLHRLMGYHTATILLKPGNEY